MTSVGDIIDLLDRRYLPSWAEAWDNPGLQVGDRGARLGCVLVALDPTLDTIREAREREAQLLITHHPLVFEPLSRVDVGEPTAAAVAEALAGGVTVFACHTNADVASPGVSDALADRLGLGEPREPLRATGAGAKVKIVTFVPEEHAHALLEAMSLAGAGAIGEYDVCSFRAAGTGTFRPSAVADPTTGTKQVVNEVDEVRFEMLVPSGRTEAVVSALIAAHPYEEPAYEVIALESAGGAAGIGLGRIGELSSATDASGLAQRCREGLGADARLVGDPGRTVRRLAVCGGSGASLVGAAIAAGADALVTGDVKHHQALEAEAAGIAIIDAGHHGTEWPWVETLAAALSPPSGAFEVAVAKTDTDPFRRGGEDGLVEAADDADDGGNTAPSDDLPLSDSPDPFEPTGNGSDDESIDLSRDPFAEDPR